EKLALGGYGQYRASHRSERSERVVLERRVVGPVVAVQRSEQRGHSTVSGLEVAPLPQALIALPGREQVGGLLGDRFVGRPVGQPVGPLLRSVGGDAQQDQTVDRVRRLACRLDG